MQPNELQYDRVARWLDCEPIELTSEEWALADEIRRDESALGAVLETAAPRVADRTRRQARAILLRGRFVRWRYAVEAVAAAAVLLLTAALYAVGQPRTVWSRAATEQMFSQTLATPQDIDISLLSGSIDELGGDLVMTQMPWNVGAQAEIDDLQQKVDDLLLDTELDSLQG